MVGPSPSSAASTRRCQSIYKGFAQCLMALGDSLTESAQDTQEIHTICKSWDEFHDCANEEMAGCPNEAAAVWESLRQESKKMQFSGNLYDMCSSRNQPADTADTLGPPNQEEINQESLKAHAHSPDPASFFLLPSCLSLVLLLLL
ncbi:neuritin 1-like a isoform X2 [Esox lucius]|uniref:neuritin 1-like a isoform X2 n=1 Tax=Esox lucius TaxID=8010 RepID=UPI0009732A90|nr:neuritin 1-like a isoform X2 [Esox lucius]